MSFKKLLSEKLNEYQISLVYKMIDNNRVMQMQVNVNKYVKKELHLEEDGIFGLLTCLAILESYSNFDDIFNIENIKNVQTKDNNEFEKFLYRFEGNKIHWLKREKGFTTPYGVYSYANPNSEVIKYVIRLYEKYGLNENIREHAYILDTHISKGERRNIQVLALKLYDEKYFGSLKNVLKHAPKTAITFFSNSVNGGLTRGYISLQSSLGVVQDGKFGKNSMSKLKQEIQAGEDYRISQGALNYMASFYCSLIRKNRNKFYRYKNGWFNRIKSLGYKSNTLC